MAHIAERVGSSVTRLRPVPQPPDPPDGDASARPNACRDCKRKDKLIATLETENARLIRAIQRESHYMDVRTPNTGKPTRERVTNGRPVTKGE